MRNQGKEERSSRISRLNEAARISSVLSAATPNGRNSIFAKIMRFIIGFNIASHYNIIPNIHNNVSSRNAKQLESFAALVEKNASYFNEKNGRNFLHEKILEYREMEPWLESQGMGAWEIVTDRELEDMISVCNSNPSLVHQVDYNGQTPLVLLFVTTFTHKIQDKTNNKVKLLAANFESKMRVACVLMKYGASIKDVVHVPEAWDFLQEIFSFKLKDIEPWPHYSASAYIVANLGCGAQFTGCLQAGITQEFLASCLLGKYDETVALVYRNLSKEKRYLPQSAKAALDYANSFFTDEITALHSARNKSTKNIVYNTPQDFALSFINIEDGIKSASFSVASVLFLSHYFDTSAEVSNENILSPADLDLVRKRFIHNRMSKIKEKQAKNREEGTFSSGGYDLIRQTIANRDILIKSLIEDGGYDIKSSNSNMSLKGGLVELAQENEVSTFIIDLLRRELQPYKHHDELSGYVQIKNLEAIVNFHNIYDELKVISRYNTILHIKKLHDFSQNLISLINKVEGKLLQSKANSDALEAIELYKPNIVFKCNKFANNTKNLLKNLEGSEEEPGYLIKLTIFHQKESVKALVHKFKGVFQSIGKDPQRAKDGAYILKEVLHKMNEAQKYAADIFKKSIQFAKLGKIYASKTISTLEEVEALLEQEELQEVSSDLKQIVEKLKRFDHDFKNAEKSSIEGKERLSRMVKGMGVSKGAQKLGEEIEKLIAEVIKCANLRLESVRKASIDKLDSRVQIIRKEFVDSLIGESLNGVVDITLVAKKRMQNLILTLAKKVNDIETLGYQAMHPELESETKCLEEVFQEIERRVQMISYAMNVLRGSNQNSITLLQNNTKNQCVNYRTKRCGDELQTVFVNFEKGKPERSRLLESLSKLEGKVQNVNFKAEEIASIIQEMSNIASKIMRYTAANKEKAAYYLDLLKYDKAKELKEIGRKFGYEDPKLKYAIEFLNEAKQLVTQRIPKLKVADEGSKLISNAYTGISLIDNLKLDLYIIKLPDLVKRIKFIALTARDLIKSIPLEERMKSDEETIVSQKAEAVINSCKKAVISLNKAVLKEIERATKNLDYHPIDVINSIQNILYNAIASVDNARQYIQKTASDKIWTLKSVMLSSANKGSNTVADSKAFYLSLIEKVESINNEIDAVKVELVKLAESKEPPIKDVEEEQLPSEEKKKVNSNFIIEVQYNGELRGIKDRGQKELDSKPVSILIGTLEEAQDRRREVRQSLNRFCKTADALKKLNFSDEDEKAPDDNKRLNSSYQDRVKEFGQNFMHISTKLKAMEQKFQSLFIVQGITSETSSMMVDIKKAKDIIQDLDKIYKFLNKIYTDNKKSFSNINKKIKNAEENEQKLLDAGMVGKKFKEAAYGKSDSVDDDGVIIEIRRISGVIENLAKDIIDHIKLGDKSINKAKDIIANVDSLINEQGAILDALLLSLGIATEEDVIAPSSSSKVVVEPNPVEQKLAKKTEVMAINFVDVVKEKVITSSSSSKVVVEPNPVEQKLAKKTEVVPINFVDVVKEDPEMKRLALFVNKLNLEQLSSVNSTAYLQSSWLNFAINPENGIAQPLLVALTVKFNQKIENKEQLMEIIRSETQSLKQELHK